MFKILPPNLHSCASLGKLFLPAKKNTPKIDFLGCFGSKEWLFEGLNRAGVVLHPFGWITTLCGPILGEK